jgi:hypothetical protein
MLQSVVYTWFPVEVKGKQKITKEMAEDQEMVTYFRGLLAVSVIMKQGIS